MRLRRGLLALVALLVAGGIASAQTTTPPKKKKRKKTHTTAVVDDPDAGEGSAPDYSGKHTAASASASDAPDYSGKHTAASASASASASAPPPPVEPPTAVPSRGQIAVNAFGGYASADLRIGFGVRGGYTLANGLYLGAAFTYHLGTRFGTSTTLFFYPAVEIGYDLRATSLITLRPYAGIGLGVEHSSDDSNVLIPAQTNPFFAFYPGAQLDLQLPHSPVFIGLDLRLLLGAGNGAPDVSFGIFLTAGARF